jgi:hypothetical protein
MDRTELTRDEVVAHTMSQAVIDGLNMALRHDDDGRVLWRELPTGVEIVGVGLLDRDQEPYIDADVDTAVAGGASCLLCRLDGAYCNLWIGADYQQDNGFDAQVDVHFGS